MVILCKNDLILDTIYYLNILLKKIMKLIVLVINLLICVCVCVSQIKKRYSILSSHPTSVRCDIEKGFITCSATLTVACSFGVGM